MAARSGMLGFTVLKDDEVASWRRDRIDQERAEARTPEKDCPGSMGAVGYTTFSYTPTG